jgi:hypothetical protein
LPGQGKADPVDNLEVIYWKSSTPNQYLAHAHVKGSLTRLYPDHSGHKHYYAHCKEDEIIMTDGLQDLLEGSGQPGLAELRSVLQDLLGEATGRLLDEHRLQAHKDRVYRLRLALNGSVRSLVIKRLEPSIPGDWLARQ